MEDFFDYIYPIFFFFVILPVLIGILFFMIQYLLCSKVKNFFVKCIPFVIYLPFEIHNHLLWHGIIKDVDGFNELEAELRAILIMPMLCGIIFAVIVYEIARTSKDKNYIKEYALIALIGFVTIINVIFLLCPFIIDEGIYDDCGFVMPYLMSTSEAGVFSLLFLAIQRLLKKHGKKKRKKT